LGVLVLYYTNKYLTYKPHPQPRKFWGVLVHVQAAVYTREFTVDMLTTTTVEKTKKGKQRDNASGSTLATGCRNQPSAEALCRALRTDRTAEKESKEF
jgi:hypothetical protein